MTDDGIASTDERGRAEPTVSWAHTVDRVCIGRRIEHRPTEPCHAYAEATRTQTPPDRIGAHVRLFRFLGGVPRLVVADNPRSGVHKASSHDPELNRSSGMMAEHHGIGVLPARPLKPRDKWRSSGPL